MNISDALRKEIEADIERCTSHIEKNGSESLYGELVAKYSIIDSNFEKGLSMSGKVVSIGSEADYRKELKAIAGKLKILLLTSAQTIITSTTDKLPSPAKSLDHLLAEDIKKCQDLLDEAFDEAKWRRLYSILTSRYDSIIKDLGISLYAYNPEHHFYDPDISPESLHHNLNIILQKMIIYRSLNQPVITNKQMKTSESISNKVFIVHGHDEAAKVTMARTLERAGFEAIILHEQANYGMTIIEKIEANTNVAYSVILYTPCDIGRGLSEPNFSERARQNVVFEHGYLIGKHGRNRVCALVKGNVETPGDISGVVYIKMDESGAWKIELAKNMRAAGLDVDLNTFCS